MISLKIELKKEDIKKGLKKGFKRGYKEAREKIKKYYEDYETLASPTKTIYYYEKTRFGKITQNLSSEDLSYLKWIDGVIESFITLGYSQVEHYVDTYNDEEIINSISFNFQRTFKYDPKEKTFWRQELQTIQQSWWREDYEEKSKPFWKEDYEKKSKPFWKDDKEKKEDVKEKEPTELKEVKVEGSITFFINYKEQSVEINMVVNVKDPQIRELYADIYKDLIDLTKLLTKKLFRILCPKTQSVSIVGEDLILKEIDYIKEDINKLPFEDIKNDLKKMLSSIEQIPDLKKRIEKIHKFTYFLYKSNLNQLKKIFL